MFKLPVDVCAYIMQIRYCTRISFYYYYLCITWIDMAFGLCHCVCVASELKTVILLRSILKCYVYIPRSYLQ